MSRKVTPGTCSEISKYMYSQGFCKGVVDQRRTKTEYGRVLFDGVGVIEVTPTSSRPEYRLYTSDLLGDEKIAQRFEMSNWFTDLADGAKWMHEQRRLLLATRWLEEKYGTT